MDWNKIHDEVQASIQLAQAGSQLPRPPKLSGRLLLQQAAEAAEECPLGLLNLAVIHFFTAVFDDDKEDLSRQSVMQVAAHVADSLASRFPVHVVCTSRWPIFEAIEVFTLKIDKEKEIPGVPLDACDEIVNGVVDWRELRKIANDWSRRQFAKGPTGEKVMDLLLVITSFIEDASKRWQQAQDECPIGSAFLAAVQAVGALAQFTNRFDNYSKVLDKAIQEGLLSAVSCGWPLGHALAVLSDANKGLKYLDRNYKYVRAFADLDLHLKELSPLVLPAQTDSFDPAKWRKQGAKKACAIARMPWHSFARLLRNKAVGRRRILRQAIDAVLKLTRSFDGSGKGWKGHRGIALTLLYGNAWSGLLERTVSHLCQLGFSRPLLVVASGKDAYQACRQVEQKSACGLKVSCWRPNTESQVHRFTIVHILLHLGLDIFYFDMDAFFLRNPLPMVLSQASVKKQEAIFASHGDGDCINIGVFYIKSTIRTTVWFSRFLEWYHEHQYEIDQRGLDVLLGSPLRIPEGELGVSFAPKDLPKVRVGVMEDGNKVVIGWIGWYGHISRMQVFHWCNSPLDEKWEELDTVYKAAEAIQDWMPLHLALSVVSTADFQVLPREASETWTVADTGKAVPGSAVWRQVGRARRVFEAYRLHKPLERLPCW